MEIEGKKIGTKRKKNRTKEISKERNKLTNLRIKEEKRNQDRKKGKTS